MCYTNLDNSLKNQQTWNSNTFDSINDARERILRFTNIPLASPENISDIIAACKYNGMCFQENGLGPAPDTNAYCFYWCMNYGGVTAVICYVASTNKLFTGSMINSSWSGWLEK